MDPYIYGAVLIGGIFLLLQYTLYTTHWDLLDTRKRLQGFSDAYDGMAAQAQSWEEKCRNAWKRLTAPPTWMQESGYDIQVGEQRVPLYKPFGVFTFNQTERLTHHTILKGNEIIESKPLDRELDVMNGDTLYLYVEVKK